MNDDAEMIRSLMEREERQAREIRRLRAALTIIATDPEAHLEGAGIEAQAIARAALAETE